MNSGNSRFSTTDFIIIILILIALAGLVYAGKASAEIKGYAGIEANYFFDDPLLPEQAEQSGSVFGEIEFYHDSPGGSGFTATVFAREDSADKQRSHFDVREFNYLYVTDRFEIKAGISKVFWGATEFIHIVDVINQTDGVEDIDEEQKLGQPMVSLSIPTDYGIFDFFVLPYFRERNFRGEKSRLRPELVIDDSHPIYESSQKERHVDWAIRYSHSLGDLEIGLSHFSGTSRVPTLQIMPVYNSAPHLVPKYNLIEQSGLDLTLVEGDWILKFEGIHVESSEKNYDSAAGGFEYTLYGILETSADIGLIVEYMRDSREFVFFGNDLALGARLALNDMASSELLFGVYVDMETDAKGMRIEGSRRVGDSVKLNLIGGAFMSAPPSDPAYSFRNDNYLRLEVAKYF